MRNYTFEQIDKLRDQLELKFLKQFGINAGAKCIKMIREVFKEELSHDI